jgi:hypothetical protein
MVAVLVPVLLHALMLALPLLLCLLLPGLEHPMPSLGCSMPDLASPMAC